MNFKYKISVASDKGTRETNEDFYGILENHKDILLVLCDGVGSEQDSDIAAKITVKTFLTRFKKRFPLFFCFSRFYNNCIKASLRKLRKLTNKNQGMGTTLCVVYIHKNIAQCANIGDSRIYYYSASQKQWSQKTFDHNLLNKIYAKYDAQRKKRPDLINIINEKENSEIELNKESLSFLTSCVSSDEEITPSTSYYKTIPQLQPNDMFFIVSDGVYHFIKPEKINELIQAKTVEFKNYSKTIIEQAIQNGSNDNLTSIVLKIR